MGNVVPAGALSAAVVFVSPFSEENVGVLGGASTVGGDRTSLRFPPSLSADEATLGFLHFGALQVKIGQKVVLGQPLFTHAGGSFSGPMPPQGTQCVLVVGTRVGQRSFSLQNVLAVDGQRVFVARS